MVFMWSIAGLVSLRKHGKPSFPARLHEQARERNRHPSQSDPNNTITLTDRMWRPPCTQQRVILLLQSARWLKCRPVPCWEQRTWIWNDTIRCRCKPLADVQLNCSKTLRPSLVARAKVSNPPEQKRSESSRCCLNQPPRGLSVLQHGQAIGLGTPSFTTQHYQRETLMKV